ncbi:E3 ubiquitin-protein ligase ZNF598-like [Saccostrea cucullata]|uniref:E3 ubiquitin-protein ligase ZNF598-like n=1 Tax=Saccostrea cuccullata TaxID=36930 RepID=UPI002ED5B0F6
MPSRVMDPISTDHDLCPVCHEVVQVFAIGHCDHPICYRCSTRMRVLCNHMYCPICRTDLNQVYMVHNKVKCSEIPRHGYIPNRKYKIFFEDGQIQKKFEKLNEFRCPKCKMLERNLKALQQHLSKNHTLFFCSLCVDHLKIFPSERKVYNRQDLAQHRRQGDKDDTSYKGHPLCQFCDERYMDNDELFKHLRKDHYYCHFCETDGSHDYYSDYADLKDHFRAKHFLCEEGDCANTQFTHAFRSKIDFQAHQSNNHSKTLSKSQAKQARTIEVDIQLAPRNRRRDKGVITANDYEDAPVQRSGAQGRGQGRSVKDRFRDEDMNRAIQASLSVMTEEKMKQSKAVEEERKTPSPELLQDTEQFPSLGKIKEEAKPLRSDSPANVDSDSEKTSSSLAQRLAKTSNLSVQHGTMSVNDFPSLSLNPSKPDIMVNVTKASKPVPNSYSVVSKSGPVGEDFPSLPSGKSKRASSATIGQWGKKPAAGGKSVKTETPLPSRPPLEVLMSDPSRKRETKKEKQRNPRNQTFTSDNDFPSLSSVGVENANTDWFRNVTENSNKKMKKEKPIDWFDINNDSDEFNIDNISGDKNNKQLISEAYKETKKKKNTNKKTKTSTSASKSGSDSVISTTASLDNIATSLLGNSVSISQEKNVQKVSKEAPVVKKEVATSEKAKTKTAPQDPIERVSDLATDLALEEKPEEEFIPVRPNEKKSSRLDSSDFPALSAVKGPPPGFSKAKSKPPPGFDNSQTSVSFPTSGLAPPPGFASSSLANSKDLNLKNLMDSFSSGSEVPSTDSPALLIESFQYEEPKDFQARNKALVMKIKDVFQDDEDKFTKFKSSSSDFRGGNVSAAEYYNKCSELIGSENFEEIFTELLVLLPDIEKQQELLEAHRKCLKSKTSSEKVLKISGKSTAAPWKSQTEFVTCTTCRQILLQKDYNQHVGMHNIEADYPSLGSNVTTSQGPGMRAWIKAN